MATLQEMKTNVRMRSVWIIICLVMLVLMFVDTAMPTQWKN
jgi:uncharacterized membrane protein affecting hemolysin expression